NISCNGCVLAFTCNLINLIDVDDSLFRTLYIKVCSLDQTQKNVFYIISDIACLSETCRIRNRKWNVKRSCQSLSEQCFTTAGRTDQSDITFGNLYIVIAAFLVDTFIMVI